MKYVDEYRESRSVKEWVEAVHSTTTQSWTIMEVCGGQTHAILRWGLQDLLPAHIRLIHGPGCPVCVTPVSTIDHALKIASLPNLIFCSFGDMLRVPGSKTSLLAMKARGADVRIVYSPLEAVQIARENPDSSVVFFGVGFETTAPANALAVYEAKRGGVTNFSLLGANMLVPPALEALLNAEECQIQGFLAAGHVCTVMGYDEYKPICDKYHVPIAVTGFEPVDIMKGIYSCIEMLEKGRAEIQNQYPRSVREKGNLIAQNCMQEVFEVVDRVWRGIGLIPRSGLALRQEYADFDASCRYSLSDVAVEQPSECISGLVLQGRKKPSECPLFGCECTPEKPCGAPMVSSEGACAAYYQHKEITGCVF